MLNYVNITVIYTVLHYALLYRKNTYKNENNIYRGIVSYFCSKKLLIEYLRKCLIVQRKFYGGLGAAFFHILYFHVSLLLLLFLFQTQLRKEKV